MVKKSKSEQSIESESGGTSKMNYFVYLVQIGLSLFAAYLNWNCLHAQPIITRVLLTMLSFFFAVYYLIFYLIFKVILGQTC